MWGQVPERCDPMYKLVISDDEGKTTVVPLVRDEITIGRKEGNTIRLTERNVSRRHARIAKADGVYKLEDLGSYNGVRLNGRAIDSVATLKAGDQVAIGDYLLALQSEGGAVAVASAAASPQLTSEARTAMLSPDAGPPARLVMLSPPAPGAEFSLQPERTRIGRGEDLDVWVSHRSISREHAEVVFDGTQYRVRDIGSSNGVRLNGRDVKDAPLAPGDLVELGQVRFRFVGPGEVYVFEADSTVQVGISEPESPGRVQFIAGGIIIVAAIAVAIWLFTLGNESPNADAATTRPHVTDVLAEALSECQQALARGDSSAALSASDRALRVSPTETRAKACRRNAEVLRSEQETLARASEFLRVGETDRAYFKAEELSAGSSLRSSNDYTAITNAYAREHLREARSHWPSSPSDTVREVDQVLSVGALSAELRSEAEQLKREAQNRSQQQRLAQPRQPPSKVAPGLPPEQCDPAQRDYNQCVIRQFALRPKTSKELAMVIESYRATGNMPEAIRRMEEYVRRYPQADRAQAYRQLLTRYAP